MSDSMKRDTTAQTCPQCLHGWHGRRVCSDANCCSCRLTRLDAWKAGYMQGWRDYPSALWRGFYPPTEVEMESENMTREDALTLRDAAYATGVVDERMGRASIPDDRAPGYTDTYPLDYNGWAVVSRPFIRVRADEVVPGDLLILDSGLSRVTGTKRYDLLNGVTTVHITGPTNIVRATHETVTVLRAEEEDVD